MDESDPEERDPDQDDGDESDRREQIRRLEHRIEQLAEIIERCRKFVLMSKIAMAFGAIWFDPTLMIAAITAVIGGAVLLGSNSSTWDEKAKALQAAEVERAELISEIDLRLVGGGNGPSLPRLH